MRDDWNDRAIDELAKRVDDVGGDLVALSGEFQILRRVPWDAARLDIVEERTQGLTARVDRIENTVGPGGLTRNQLVLTVVSGLFLVATTLIGAWVTLKTSTPVPTR